MSYNEILSLNVGGTKFMTSRQTLMREPASVLGRMFDIDSPLQPAAMQDGAFFLDRDPKKFEIILNYLREDDLAELTKTELINLKIEARYFQLTNLEKVITARLNKMDVYKFRYRNECYQVAKSYFRKVPLEAIVKFMCEETSLEQAFHPIGFPIKATCSDDEITSFNILAEDYPVLDNYIKAVRDHLVLYDEYVRVKPEYINIKICGQLFKLKTSVALKDPQSSFYKCWHNMHDLDYPLCLYSLNIDDDGIILIDSICICKDANCRTKLVNYEGNEALDYDKRTVLESLEKLETCAILEIMANMGPIAHILQQIGFLSDYD